MSSSEWKEVALEQIVDVLGDGLHGTPKYDENGKYYFINGNNLDGNIIIDEKTKKVSHEEFLKYKKDLNERTILISINGTLGNVAFYNGEKVVLGKSACYFNVKENCSKEFIKYIMLSHAFKHYINTYSTGTTIKNMGLKQMRAFRLNLPEINEQKAIAHILSTLDDKIEVNNQINKTLENMAQAIFKQWFVDFEFPNEDGEPYKSSGGEMVESELGMIPRGWEVVKLNSVVDICYGKNLPTKKLLSDGYPVFGGNGQIGFYSEYLYEKSQVLIACRGAASGKVIVSLPYSFVTNNSLILEQNGTTVTHEYLKQFCLEKEFYNYATGSAQPQITIANLANANILIPHRDLMNMFSLIRNSIDSKVLSLFNENNKLVAIRDALLPKLMSGEIRVPLDKEGDAS